MLDSTFFKFLIVFIGIIGLSFLVMGITGGINSGDNLAKTAVEKAVVK